MQGRKIGPYSRGLYEAYTQGHGTSPVHRAGIAGPHTREQGRAQPHSTRPQGHRQARRQGTQQGQAHAHTQQPRSQHAQHRAARAPRQAVHLHQMKDATPCTTCMWYSSSIEAGGGERQTHQGIERTLCNLNKQKQHHIERDQHKSWSLLLCQ